MKQILVYGDSLSWGIIPDTRGPFEFHQRWPGVLENTLNQLTKELEPVRVMENCVNGRRTTWSDPYKSARDGPEGLAQVTEMHSPLSLVILLLGANDFLRTHDNNAWLSAQGTAKLIGIIRQAPIEPGMPVPNILLVAPPTIVQPKGAIADKFEGAQHRCVNLSEELKKVAEQQAVFFFDSNSVTEASLVDGIHLDLPQHQRLGEAIAQAIVDQAMTDAITEVV